MGHNPAPLKTHLHVNVKVTAPIIWPGERSGYSFILLLNTYHYVEWTKPLIFKEDHSCKIIHEKICAHAETLGLSSNELETNWEISIIEQKTAEEAAWGTEGEQRQKKHKPASSRPKADELTEGWGEGKNHENELAATTYTKWTKKHESLHGLGLIIKTLIHMMSKEDNIKNNANMTAAAHWTSYIRSPTAKVKCDS